MPVISFITLVGVGISVCTARLASFDVCNDVCVCWFSQSIDALNVHTSSFVCVYTTEHVCKLIMSFLAFCNIICHGAPFSPTRYKHRLTYVTVVL